MNRGVVLHRLRRWAAASPAAFRQDPVFRVAAISAVLAFLMLLGRLGAHGPNPIPPSPPPTGPEAPLSADGASGSGGSPAPAAPTGVASGPIAPSRSLNGLTITPDPTAPVDRFGAFEATQVHKKDR